MLHFDVVHACDARYSGGTASALRGEVAAARAWGLRAAVLPYLGPARRVLVPMDARLMAQMPTCDVPFLAADSPATCDVLLAHHPEVFRQMPDRPVALRPGRVVLVLHHPPLDGAGQGQYDIAQTCRNLERCFAAPVTLAPVGPRVRAQLALLDVAPGLILPDDLPNILNLADWPMRDTTPGPDRPVVLGRHSRASPLKWPADPAAIAAAWPDLPPSPDFPGTEIRILGDVTLPEGLSRPANWHVLPFRETGVAKFLQGIDFYVYFHHPDWVEAFGIAVAEALACGLVTILPPSFGPVFGDGAVYATPGEVPGLIAHFTANPDAYRAQSRAARHRIEARHSVESYDERMRRLWSGLGLPAPAALAAPPRPVPATPDPPSGGVTAPAVFARPPARERVLLICGNGIGLGHVTRLMAIARRLPDWVEPVFLTRSLGTHLLRDQGFSADYIESFTRSGVTDESWNEAFAVETLAAIEATGARMALFDSNNVYPGLARLMPSRPDVHWLWVRRALWQPHHRLNEEAVPLFRAVIEPAELAGDEDGGPTVGQPNVFHVGPVLICRPEDRLPRDAAARQLGVDPARRAVALQLGSGRNFDMAPVRRALLAALAAQDVQVIEIANPLASPPEAAPGDPPRRAVFPLYPLTRAIDLMITAPGYNSFHECAFGGVPAIFVPNQHSMMDDQHLRALWAQAAGLGLCLTLADAPRAAADAVARALSPDFAAKTARRSAALPFTDGAAAIARLMVEGLTSIRTDGRLSLRLPRL